MFYRKSTGSYGLFRLAPLSIGILALGCGGGGGGSTVNPGGPSQTSHVGPVAVTFTGHPQAEISGSTNQVTAVGQAGASFTNLSINPAHSLSSTFIAFGRQLGGGNAVSFFPATGVGPATFPVGSGYSYTPSFSQSGVMAFFTDMAGNFSIDTMLSDGSQQKLVLASTEFVLYPTISPNGATIAYMSGDGNIYTIPSSGGTPAKIYSGGEAASAPPVWSPNGSQIAFTATNIPTSSLHVYTMTSLGASLSDITPSSFSLGNTKACSWSPDGNTLACSYVAQSASTSAVATISPTAGFSNPQSPSSFNDLFPSFSPDGSEIAFYRTNAGGATPGIYVSSKLGSSPQLLLPDPTTAGETGPVTSLTWSPFLESQTFIGAHGTITASPVSGFLVSQNGANFASLLTFTANTPSTATLTQSGSSTTGAPLAYTLGADSITNIAYTNVYNGAHVTIPLTSTPTTVVTIDAITGFVDYVVPGIAGKAHPAVARSSGSSIVYTGAFSAIYDSTGKNLAPSGASSVEFDRSTGKLVSFR